MDKKKFIALFACLMLVSALMIPAFATSAETGALSSDLTSAFSTGFQTVASTVTQILVVIVPIALGIMGVIWVSRKAIGWFKSMSR